MSAFLCQLLVQLVDEDAMEELLLKRCGYDVGHAREA